jgi:hypothetical protein
MLGSRMLAPYFGTDIFVWANLIGIFLLSISIGNYIGGKLSSKKNILIIVSICSLALLIYTMLTYKEISVWVSGWFTKEGIVEYTQSTGYSDKIIKPLFACIVLFFPVIFFLSMITPIIIKRLTNVAQEAGKVAGRVYAISTAGNLIGTFFTSFYLLVKFTTSSIFIIFFIIFLINILIITIFKLDRLNEKS